MTAEAVTTTFPRFDNSYARLPERFFVRQQPAGGVAPSLIRLNRPLADALGIDPSDERELAAVFAGNRVPDGADPLAMAYAGHQFGNFVGQLGDGRALLLGEVIDRQGIRRDIHLKGSGRTPFSRMGDGRAALGPVLREYILSEAMHALGVPTTRAIAAVATGETVYRETPLPGAVLARLARSHVRVGTFQYFAARNDTDAVRALADYVIERHDPDLRGSHAPYAGLLRRVVERQARLVAEWLGLGFIHGVMNTDNTSLSGETIDYGPCAFMDAYDPATVFSSIDRGGRYAYANQPRIAQWNLCRFAETLLALIDPDSDRAVATATEIVEEFGPRFETAWMDVMRRKLALTTERDGDRDLIMRLLSLMEAAGADFTLSFRALSRAAENGEADLAEHLGATEATSAWHADWQARVALDETDPATVAARLRDANPALIPRNHRVEAAIVAAEQHGDFAPFHRLADILADPFAPEADALPEAAPPLPHERVAATFCGT